MPAATCLLDSFQEQALYRAAQMLCTQRLAKGNQTLLKQAGFGVSSKKKTFRFSMLPLKYKVCSPNTESATKSALIRINSALTERTPSSYWTSLSSCPRSSESVAV